MILSAETLGNGDCDLGSGLRDGEDWGSLVLAGRTRNFRGRNLSCFRDTDREVEGIPFRLFDGIVDSELVSYWSRAGVDRLLANTDCGR